MFFLRMTDKTGMAIYKGLDTYMYFLISVQNVCTYGISDSSEHADLTIFWQNQ